MARSSVVRLSRCVIQHCRCASSALHTYNGASSTLLLEHVPSSTTVKVHSRQLSAFACAQRDLRTGTTCRHAETMPTHSRRHMFIQTQPTPNPSSLMFLPGKQVMEQGSKEFSNMREAMASPLATALFRIEGVAGVFFGSDFVTIKVLFPFFPSPLLFYWPAACTTTCSHEGKQPHQQLSKCCRRVRTQSGIY